MARIAIDGRMIGPALHGGIGRYVAELIQGISKTENLKDEYFIILNKDSAVPDLGNKTKLNIIRANSKFVSIKEQQELYELTELYKIDLFHATSFVAPVFRRAKLIITIHDLIHLIRPEDYSFIHKLYYKTLVKNHIKTSARIITDSESSKNDILSFYDCDPEKISVIPLGISGKFTPGKLSDSVARKYNLPNEYALYIGSSKPHKNLNKLLEAFDGVPENIPLVVGGVYKKRSEIKRKNTYFLGKIPDNELVDIYRGAKIFVYPSLIEGFGFNPLEAMACGVPVITSNVTSLPEVVGDAGVLINPENKDEIANKVLSLWNNEELLHKLSKKGISQAGLFTWEKTIAKTLAIYESVVHDEKV